MIYITTKKWINISGNPNMLINALGSPASKRLTSQGEEQMARFVHIDYPAQHGGVTRFTRGIVASLAAIGRPLTRAYGNWAAARTLRREDEKLWNLALSDARIMADLSRAMSQDAQRDIRAYY